MSLVPINTNQWKNRKTPSNNITSGNKIVNKATPTFALINLYIADETNTTKLNKRMPS